MWQRQTRLQIIQTVNDFQGLRKLELTNPE